MIILSIFLGIAIMATFGCALHNAQEISELEKRVEKLEKGGKE